MNILVPIAQETRPVLIGMDKIVFSYSEKPIFKCLNLSLAAGEMVGIIGPNGAGKTTLLRLMMGLLQPQRGEITLRGKPLGRLSRRDLAQAIALVPQDTQIGYAFSVREIVAMGRNPYLGRFRPPQPQDEAIVDDAIRETRLTALADRHINTLSGGERQRVLIARAIAQCSSVVLLDEATANLDLCHQLEVMELANSLKRKNCLIVAAIHDLAMASRYCDRLILVAEGDVQADGPPNSVLSENNLSRFFSLSAIVGPNPDLPRGLSITPLAPLSDS